MQEKMGGPCGMQRFQWENLNKKVLEELGVDGITMLTIILRNRRRGCVIFSFGAEKDPCG
jgi:hypothetical protein